MASPEKIVSKRKNLWIDAKLHHLCDMEATRLGMTIQEYVDELIRAGLKTEKKK